MQPSRKSRVNSARRLVFFALVAAQAIRASPLPGARADHLSARTLAAAEGFEVQLRGEEVNFVFSPASFADARESASFVTAGHPMAPSDFGFDSHFYPADPPRASQGDPLRSAEPPSWMSVGMAAVLLAGTRTEHRRRRTRTGQRHNTGPPA